MQKKKKTARELDKEVDNLKKEIGLLSQANREMAQRLDSLQKFIVGPSENKSLVQSFSDMDNKLLTVHNLLLKKEVFNKKEFIEECVGVEKTIQAQARELEFKKYGYEKRPGVAGKDDLIIIDMSASIDGEKKDTLENHLFILEQNDHVEGFSKHFLGKNEGEIVQFTIDYPEDKKYEDFAGKSVFHKCEIKVIRKKIETNEQKEEK